MNRFTIPTAATLLTLAGCTVGPQYTQPPVTSHDQFHGVQDPQNGPSRLTSTAAADLQRWWTRLNDSQLDSLLERSVAANLDLRLAQARLREARAQRGVVAADQWPTVNANGGYERSKQSDNGRVNIPGEPSEGSDLYHAGFDASWELDFFGRVKRSVEAADADLAASEEARNDVLVSLVAEVARNYVELRGFQRRVAVTESSIQTERDSVDLVQARFNAGLATELDVAQAQAQVATRQSQLPPLYVGMRRAAHRLSILMGLEPGALLGELAQPAPIPGVPAEVAVGVPADLIRRRPDIRRTERQIAAATARVGVATADLYPRFTLFGSFGLESGQIGDLVDMNSRRWSIGPSFTWPIFDAGRVRSTINVRDAQMEQSIITYERSVLNAYEEVENAMVTFVQEQDRRAFLLSAVESSERAVNLARERYQSGVVDFLNVLDSQRLLYQSQDQLSVSEQAVTVELISLYKALGGGWESMVQPAGKPADQKQEPASPPDNPPGK